VFVTVDPARTAKEPADPRLALFMLVAYAPKGDINSAVKSTLTWTFMGPTFSSEKRGADALEASIQPIAASALRSRADIRMGREVNAI
jgi:hypothetical protein